MIRVTGQSNLLFDPLSNITKTAVVSAGSGPILYFGRLTDYFYSHNQLYGKWYINRAGEDPETNRQLRAELQTDQQSALLYSASEIDVMDGESIKEHPYLVKLDPDVL